MRALKGVFVVGALAMLLSACRVDVVVEIVVGEDGSGTVTVEATFDADAVAAMPDLEALLRLDDLEAAGWQLEGPAAADSVVTVTATKDVPSAGQFQQVLDEIAGPGVFDDVTITADSAFAEGSRSLSLDVKLWD